jgi:hypothetical protein
LAGNAALLSCIFFHWQEICPIKINPNVKTFFLIIPLTFLCFIANAQLKGFSIGPYAERAWPRGNFGKLYKNGIGAGVGADIKLPGNLGLTGSLGIIRFPGKEFQNGELHEKMDALTATPIRIGLKYRLPLVYLKMETGTARMNDEGGSGVILSPGAGIRVLGLDVQLKYETWLRTKSYSFLGLKASYNF